MYNHLVFATPADVAATVAQLTSTALQAALAKHTDARWLLAGGTAPLAAYDTLATKYSNSLDWSRVYVALGDERCVPATRPDATWPLVARTVVEPLKIPRAQQLIPHYDADAEVMARNYAAQLRSWSEPNAANPRFDLAWLGMGEDGHTLSLFPGDPAAADSPELVVAVHNSPKLPSDRISLSLQALTGVSTAIIIVAGAAKANVIGRIFNGGSSLPAARAVEAIMSAGGQVTWVFDESAARKITER